MRIDRRGNPGYREIPAVGESESNVDLTGARQLEPAHVEGVGDHGENRGGDLPSTPSGAFGDLNSKDHGFLKKVASVFAAVGRALKEIKQGSSRTFD